MSELADRKWQEAIDLCREVLVDRAAFEAGEVAYKHEIATNIRAALAAAEAGAPLLPAIKKAFGKPNNLLYFVDISRFRDWTEGDEAGAREALLALTREGSTADRVDAFSARIPREVLKSPGARIAFAAFFLMGTDPARYPIYRAEAIKGAERLLGWPAAPTDASLGEQYEHHVRFVAAFRDRLREGGLDEVRDMLDAQSLIWMLMKWGDPQFKAWRGERPTEPVVHTTPLGSPGGGQRPDTFEDLARELYVDARFIREVLDLLEYKRQLVFYGPPGTGKTYIARRLVGFIAGGDARRTETVQFHPSYSYEDFVQGYRPRGDQAGDLRYELVDGPLVRLAERARARPDKPHVLLVDEINRGNLPRIFGELLYLLEYRDDEIALMYGGDDTRFSLPANLWVIGTMNTADRSIGLIDAALRRRFHFKALFPGRPPLDGLLERWLADHVPQMSAVAAYVEQLNDHLRERFGDHLQIGHSYFMTDALDELALERIWEVDILPFLEDQLFGKEEELKRFELPVIRAEVEGPEVQPAPDEPAIADDQPDRIRAEG